MILKHENLINEGKEDESIEVVKTVSSKAQAVSSKVAGKNYIHYCYHDEGQMRPCKREPI